MPTTKANRTTQKAKKRATSKKPKGSKNGQPTKAARTSKKAAKKAATTAKKAATTTAARPPANGAKGRRDRQPPKDKRQLVLERKVLRSQSRWLQKALFALAKAEDDQAKLAEVRGDAHEPMAVTIDGTTHQVGAVTDSLRDSVMDRLEGLRVTLREEHALMG